ncbi:peroxisome proliferator-activated receptor gamma coactivator 1-beta [Rhinophrynus dorsalis]
MADCSTLLDDDLESFFFSYLTDSPEPGVEPLSLDFPEIDLSQLDANDFDSNNYFNELQWCKDYSENESSQYSTDDSELLQIIDSDNEALLAALTETLDDIQEDEISLSAFISSGDGDFCPLPALSPKPSLPAESPKNTESEDELSILKKLLLSPAQTPTSNDAHNEGNSQRHGTSKFRPHRTCSKVESPTDRQSGISQGQNRSCTELHRHLVSSLRVPQTSSKEDCQETFKEEDSDSNEEEQSEDEPMDSLLSPAPEQHKPQFTCEKEKRAVVDLIRYMHTYCLPVKKHHTQQKHQHCNGLLKRPKPESTQQTQSSSSNLDSKVGSKIAKDSCPADGKYKRTKTTNTRFSILKQLLAKDISGDVSKPYRLTQPVYAAFSDSCVSNGTQRKTESGEDKCLKTVEFVKTHKSCLTLKRDSRSFEQDSVKIANSVQENVTLRTAPKQETSIYPVRRSSRLNPEFSEWLLFDDETSPLTCEAPASVDIELSPAGNDFCFSTELFGDEQVTEVEVGDLMESFGLVQEDITVKQKGESLEWDANEAHHDIVTKPCHPIESPRCPSLSLAQNDSAFEKRNFEQTLTVELCGTAGLTPPTTPPYKPTEEDHYKPVINPEPVKSDSLITTSSKVEDIDGNRSINQKLLKKHPERTELFAHLSRTADLPASSESQGIKRPFSRSFGDHDYCQVRKPEPTFQRKLVKSLDLPYVERKPKPALPPVHPRKVEKKTDQSQKEDSKLLKDHEIRESLTKHFGFPENTLKGETDVICNSPKYDSVFEDSDSECSSPLEDDICFSPLRTKVCSRRSPLSKTKLQCYPVKRSSPRSPQHNSPDSRSTFRCESSDMRQTGNLSQKQMQKRREKAIEEGREIYIRNLSSTISASELKRRFEVFGEITDCRVISKNRGERYGFITYRCSEYAAMSLKKGASLRKRNEPSFHLSYGGLRHFFWTKYRDLDSNAEEPWPMIKKSKYESMDFDSLLKEAQRSLHR